MTRPAIVAVDFDGVLNALPVTEADLGHYQRWQRRRVLGYRLTVAGEVLEWLATLPERGGQFHWATTWTPNRHLLEQAFGLPGDAPIAADPDDAVPASAPGVSWKGAQVAARVAADPRPLVWLDDDAITEGTATMLAALARRLDLAMLAVVPRMASGVVPAELDLVDEFLSRVRHGQAPPGLKLHRADRA